MRDKIIFFIVRNIDLFVLVLIIPVFYIAYLSVAHTHGSDSMFTRLAVGCLGLIWFKHFCYMLGHRLKTHFA